MDCSICLEKYDREARVPKNLPCGHTACLPCLELWETRECPTCRRAYIEPPAALPNSFQLLEVLELLKRRDTVRSARGWCSDCRAAAAGLCWDEHEVVSAKAALRRHLPAGVLQRAAVQLEALQRQVQEEAALRALALLSAPSWGLSLRAGGLELRGAVENNEDPLVKAVWLVLAARAGLTEKLAGDAGRSGAAVGPPPAAASPAPTAVRPPPADASATPAAASPSTAAASAAPAVSVPPTASPLTRELDVTQVYNRGAGAKAAALRDAEGVTRLVGVQCDKDPAWSLQLLQRAAPTLERLQVSRPREDHLRCIHSMPRLRRLDVFALLALDLSDLKLPALPPGHSGLRWLCVCLPRAPLQSLLRAHAGTLEELRLRQWIGCDLHVLLKQCGLWALRRLVLLSVFCGSAVCRKQREKVRRALPGLQEVLCRKCDSLEYELL